MKRLGRIGGIVLSGLLAACAATRDSERFVGAEPGSALLGEVRRITRDEGLVAAKERLIAGLAEQDGSRGELESRVMRTTRDPSLVYPDSLAALSASERSRIAFAIVPGTKAAKPNARDRTRECLRGAAEASRSMGFSTWFIETEARGTVESNARLVAAQMQQAFAASEHVVLVMLSKGSHDVIRYLREDGVDLPPAQRAKLAVILSLAGTLQGSVVADWMAHSTLPAPRMTRAWLRHSGQKPAISMLDAVARSPWQGDAASAVSTAFPGTTWIAIAMVPDGEDGRITERLWAPGIRRSIERTAPYYSPVDGLVETAASVLPDAVTLEEWVVTGYGSHAIPNGVYRDGGSIAPLTSKPGREKLSAENGEEVMSAYLRALPQELLD